MKKLMSLLFIVFTISGVAAAPLHPKKLSHTNYPAFNAVQKKLSSTTRLTGQFKQIRTLPILSKPLVATGHFVFSRHKGLQWYQTTPFKSSLIVTQDTIKQQIGDTPPNILTEDKQPIVFAFTNIFLAVFNGNIKMVEHYFQIYFAGNQTNWQINLKPISYPLNKGISLITLKGAAMIRSITITDSKHNQTVIYLTHLKGQR